MPSGRTIVALFLGATLCAGAGWATAPAALAQEAGASLPADDLPVEEAAVIGFPEAPATAATAEKDQALTARWSKPESDGGSPVTGYDIVVTPRTSTATSQTITTDAETFSADLAPLGNGVTYDIAIRARNVVGAGAPRETSGTPRTVPGVPRVGEVTAADGAAVVRWEAPLRDGGATISTFVVRADPGDAAVRVGGGATSARVTGLSNGAPATFTVTAENEAGAGTPSGASASVVPRAAAKFVIKDQPRRRVVFGAPTTVRTALVTAVGGKGLPGQRVELLARPRSATQWRRVDAGVTDSTGRATLTTRLRQTAALRLRHQAGVVAAPSRDVRSVVVANRVTRSAGSTRTRLGMRAVVRGRVAPRHHVGTKVVLQRHVSGSWVKVGSGRMTTRQQYVVRWRPRTVGTYALRVKKPAGAGRAAGYTSTWHHRVDPENAADVAADIRRDNGITLAEVHLSGGSDGATAKQNIDDVAAGRRARTSCHGGAPCTSTTLDIRVLRAIREMGRRGTITVSELAGGVHAGSSVHYSGRAVDITWVHGQHVGYGTSYGMVVDVCRAYGANEIFTPANDPWGGHSTHVHCGW